MFTCGLIVTNNIYIVVKSKSAQETDYCSDFRISTTTDDIMISPNQIEKEMSNLFFNLL